MDHAETHEDALAVLRERSARYAARASRSAKSAREAEKAEALLVVKVGTERLAFSSAEVVAVVRRAGESPLSLAPAHVPFAIAFRGEAVLVVALPVLQGAGAPPPSPLQRVVVVRWKTGRVGLLVDEALGVQRVPRSQLGKLAEHSWLPTAAVEGVLPDGTVLVQIEGLARELASGGN
jgi:chemotaxis signal transduction protein